MSQFLHKGKIPTWRLIGWALVAVVGVAYFTHSDSPRLLVWCFAAFAGMFILGFGLMLNWAPSSPWMRAHAYWLVAIGALGNILLLVWKLLDLSFHNR